MNKPAKPNAELIDHRLSEVEGDVNELTKNVNDLTIAIKLMTSQFAVVKWVAAIAGSSVIIQAIELITK